MNIASMEHFSTFIQLVYLIGEMGMFITHANTVLMGKTCVNY